MNDPGHDEIRLSLGAYLLNALDEHERERVAEHLESCPTCRAELTELATLPARLATLTPTDIDALTVDPSSTSAARFLTTAMAQRHRRQRVQRVWQAIAIAATIVAAISIVRRPAATPEPAGLALTAIDGGSATATAAPIPKPWGTEVRLNARQLTNSNGYKLWAVDRSGHREIAATWAATPANAYHVTGATGISGRDLARIEVTTIDDTPLLTREI